MRSESLPPAWLTSVRVAGCLQLLPPGASVALYLGSRQPGSANPQCQRCCQEAVSLQLHPIDSKALQYAFSSRHATSGWFLVAQTEEKPRLRLRKDEMLRNLGTKLPLPSQVPLKTHAGRASGTEERRYTYPQGPRITLCTRSTGKHRPCHQLLSSTLGLAQTSSEANCPIGLCSLQFSASEASSCGSCFEAVPIAVLQLCLSSRSAEQKKQSLSRSHLEPQDLPKEIRMRGHVNTFLLLQFKLGTAGTSGRRRLRVTYSIGLHRQGVDEFSLWRQRESHARSQGQKPRSVPGEPAGKYIN